MSNYVFGNDSATLLGNEPRYFYALRRTQDGDLYVSRVDQLDGDTIEVNNPGDAENNYEKFTVGIDLLNGIAANREKIYPNLKFDQFRWDDKFLSYYINSDGELVVKIGKSYDYTGNI